MQDQELANRLVNYSDALVAVVFVGMSAVGVAVGDPDLRCEFSRVSLAIAFSNLLMGSAFSAILMVLRRWELILRADEGASDHASRYERLLTVARHVILWLCVIMTIVLVLVAARDEVCRVLPGAAA